MPHIVPYTCVFLLICSPLLLWGQTGSPVFPAERYEELRRDVVFEAPQAEAPQQAEKAKPLAEIGPYRWPLIAGVATLVVGGLAFLLYRIRADIGAGRRGGSSPAEVQGPVDVGEVREEEIVNRGISPALLRRAEVAGQYDVAVRLLYLDLLSRLQLAHLIGYRPHFSNRDYRAQLSGHPLNEDFSHVVRAYERFWYGKHRIDRLSYRVTHQAFTALMDRIP